MVNHKSARRESPVLDHTASHQTWMASTFDPSHDVIPNWPRSFTVNAFPALGKEAGRERRTFVKRPKPAQRVPMGNPEMTVAEFIQQRFVPEHVASMRSAGHQYFHAILKHVLGPEQVDRTFGVNKEKSRTKLRTIPGWPYLNAQRLCDIHPDHIQRIISAALDNGYSIQTVTHIRNVIRKVFSHARDASCFHGENPAARVVLPRMARKQSHVLTSDQLRQAIHNMRYPEKDVALLSILTDMNVAEIFGLQWKYINSSEMRRLVDGESLPPHVIAVRNLSYRNQIRIVMGSRKREIPISDLVDRVLQNIKARKQSAPKNGFVFSSRKGTPINQDNVAARRLKLIGKQLGMPWLSWNVFHRTSAHLTPESHKQLHSELKNWLSSCGPSLTNRFLPERLSRVARPLRPGL
jgi:site-specific recombinase XerC